MKIELKIEAFDVEMLQLKVVFGLQTEILLVKIELLGVKWVFQVQNGNTEGKHRIRELERIYQRFTSRADLITFT